MQEYMSTTENSIAYNPNKILKSPNRHLFSDDKRGNRKPYHQHQSYNMDGEQNTLAISSKTGGTSGPHYYEALYRSQAAPRKRKNNTNPQDMSEGMSVNDSIEQVERIRANELKIMNQIE